MTSMATGNMADSHCASSSETAVVGDKTTDSPGEGPRSGVCRVQPGWSGKVGESLEREKRWDWALQGQIEASGWSMCGPGSFSF